MLMLFFPRDDYATPQTADQAPDNQGSSSKTTSIIIGVVVGGVAAIAITAGIMFFFIKKRKWDKIRQCEERLIDYQLATGHSSKLHSRSVTPEDHQQYLNMLAAQQQQQSSTTTTAYPYSPANVLSDPMNATAGQQGTGTVTGHRARGMSAPASTTLGQALSQGQGPSPEAPPPTYQSLHPRYDPSRYSQMSTRFSSSFDFPRSSTSTNGNSIPGVLPGHGHGQSSSLSFSPPESSTWYQQQQKQQGYAQYPQYQPAPAGSEGQWPLASTGMTTTTTTAASGTASGSRSGSSSGSRSNARSNTRFGRRSASESGIDGGETTRGPRRPRPVLSRLITNFG
ncbi:hypothetical protein BJX68DRAFT_11652 [Aspergillus pseudodeflectus]|uniref:Uncharacterized protein n=1 Tax=Aspergillus pseudodeflectus TaxID=176178 RepID=A0ABR4LB64_9EURO